MNMIMKAILTKAAILAADDLKKEPLSVPEWGGDVLISEISAEQRDECGKAYIDLKDRPQLEQITAFRNRMLVYAIVGEDGKPLFTLEEIGALLSKNGDVIDRLAKAALKLNKMEPNQAEADAKPSGTDPSAGSSSV